MKFLLSVIFNFLVMASVMGQDPHIPANLQSKFNNSYPNAAAVEWQESADHYKVEFVDKKNLHHTIVYSKEGRILINESEIDDQAVIKPIREYFIKNFPNEPMGRVWKVEDETGKLTYYSPVKDAVIFFDKDGKFIRRDERTPENMDQK